MLNVLLEQNTVPEQSVAAYFADISEIPAKLQPLEIDLFGNIQNWPKDFFGDEMGDVAEHAKAAMFWFSATLSLGVLELAS